MINYKDLGLVNTREMFAKAIKGGYAIPAFNFDPLHKRIRKRQVRLSGILHGIFLQHTDKVIGGYTAEQYAFLTFFL